MSMTQVQVGQRFIGKFYGYEYEIKKISDGWVEYLRDGTPRRKLLSSFNERTLKNLTYVTSVGDPDGAPMAKAKPIQRPRHAAQPNLTRLAAMWSPWA